MKKISHHDGLISVLEGQGFGGFGGQFVSETLIESLRSLERAYLEAKKSDSFYQGYLKELKSYAGRPTPLSFAKRLSQYLGGARIYLKREDLNHTGSHKINNVLGQMLLAKRMKKKRIIAETGAGQHGVATATVAAHLGLQCSIYMGWKDARRQKLNVFHMKALGADVVRVQQGAGILKEAINQALRDWVSRPHETYYLIGSALGPHPYPRMVRHFQSVIGREAKKQILEVEEKLPKKVIACVGGGSNAIGLFSAFLDDPEVELIGVEAGGKRAHLETGHHASRFQGGKVGFFHGMKTYVIQDEEGQIATTQSLAAGLDYPAVGPEHAFLFETERVRYPTVLDQEALSAFKLLAQLEGILPAFESAHALAQAIKEAPKMGKEEVILVNVSGRGDKDLMQLFERKNESYL